MRAKVWVVLAALIASLATAQTTYADTPINAQPSVTTEVATAPAPAVPAATTDATPVPEPVAAPTDPAQPDTQKWWQGLMVTIIETVLAIAAPVLTVLLGGLLRKWKLNVEKEKLEWIVGKAVGYGDQMAKRALKDGKPMEGPDILKAAVEKGDAWLANSGLKQKWGAYLADLIEAKLAGTNAIEARIIKNLG